jgi:hypothetical protein
VVWKASELLPKPDSWPPYREARPEVEHEVSLGFRRPVGEDLEDHLPVHRLTDEQARDIKEELLRVNAALVEARRLADFGKGRLVLPADRDRDGPTPTEFQRCRTITNLLRLDAMVRAHDGDADGALRSSLAMLNTGRAIGDEPGLIAQFVHQACVSYGLVLVERTLAQGEPAPSQLLALQEWCVSEAACPVEAMAYRGERALAHQQLTSPKAVKRIQMLADFAERGFAPPNTGSLESKLKSWWRATLPEATWVRCNHAQVLREYPDFVKFDQLAPIGVNPEFQRLARSAVNERDSAKNPRYRTIYADAVFCSHVQVARALTKGRAKLHCTAIALAAERYRREHGVWPGQAELLVPKYLDELLEDPFTGAPLKVARLDDGLVIYSVGQDGRDDGGDLDHRSGPSKDVGFRLWDVDKRCQPPPPPPPALEPPLPGGRLPGIDD